MHNRVLSLLLAGVLLLSCAACSQAHRPTDPSPSEQAGAPVGEDTVLITLSDSGVTSTDDTAVRTGDEIIYYKDGTDETYGEGEDHQKHTAEEAAAHTVVTITQPGTYRITGRLSQGQIFVDLGEDAKSDPNAVVTLILDNADITCTVAPAVFFYRVFECDTAWVAYDEGETEAYDGSPTADTTAAGANVVIAAGSVNNISGSHVARIYKEGTTKKLHKYDGAFYSKMSMNIYGDNGDDSGVLNITADNEGLDSEVHLTIHGGTLSIESQDDGINTNEDYVSVTTVNGGNLTVNAGLGTEGDGIDSNGWLTLNGGTVTAMSNDRSPDGGIDADCAITVNGGTLYAFGTRNDAADKASAHPYMELSFASTLSAGTSVAVKDETGSTLWEAVTQKACQSITLTTPALALNTVYHVYVNDTLQCYSGNSFGMMGGSMGGQPPEGIEFPKDMENMTPPEGMEFPEDMENMTPPEGMEFPEDMENMTPPEGMEFPEDMENRTPPEGFDPDMLPEDFNPTRPGQHPDGMGGGRGGMGGMNAGNAEGETDFILTETVKSFSGVCDSAQSGKTSVSFRIEGRPGAGELTAITCSDNTLALDQIQITVTDDPSEDYAESCLLSEGMDAVNDLLPGDAGNYLLTVAVISGNADCTGASQVRFTVAETETTQD